jgi:hypothetical protein
MNENQINVEENKDNTQVPQTNPSSEEELKKVVETEVLDI